MLSVVENCKVTTDSTFDRLSNELNIFLRCCLLGRVSTVAMRLRREALDLFRRL